MIFHRIIGVRWWQKLEMNGAMGTDSLSVPAGEPENVTLTTAIPFTVAVWVLSA